MAVIYIFFYLVFFFILKHNGIMIYLGIKWIPDAMYEIEEKLYKVVYGTMYDK